MTSPMTHDNRIDLQRPDAPELAAPGPHAVGVQTLTLTNAAQPDVLAGKGLRDRVLVVEHWYPSSPGTGTVQPYRSLLRDGRTEVSLHGAALRGPSPSRGTFRWSSSAMAIRATDADEPSGGKSGVQRLPRGVD